MHKLAEICVRRPVFATMLVLALTVVGAFSFFGLNVDLLPKVDLPMVQVTVVNPGAAPEPVETEITKKIEGAVNTISGIEEVHSSSTEGRAAVAVSFQLDKNGDVAAQEVRDKVALVTGDLPETARPPVVEKFDTDASPILRVVVSAPRPLREVTHIAEKQIKEQIENLKGVGLVQILGGARREIDVDVNPDRMRAYGLTVADVAGALRQENLELPGGRVDQGSHELTVRTLGRIADSKDFNDVVVANRGTYAVRISDIGHATDGEQEVRSASLLNGRPAVELVVSKQSGENVVAVARAVRERLAEIAPSLPRDVHAEVIADESAFIQAAVESIETHLIEGSLLAAVVIFLFLASLRTTLIAAIAIPTSIISTFGLMAAMNYSLNQITMLALTLMVGIVIDDAIIVLENIYRFIEEKGLPPFQAAIEGTREIGLAVMATTLSLLAVFVPVGFMGGIVGRFMSSFGLTASFAIAVSLLVSFTLTPMLGARWLRPLTGAKGHSSKEAGLFARTDRLYTRMLQWSMAHRRAMVGLSVLVVVSIVPLFALIGKNFVPDDDRSEFEITMRAGEESSLPATETVAERVARDVRQIPGVTATLTTVGGGTQQAVNAATIYVKLSPIGDRDLNQQEIMVRARELLKSFPPGLRTSVQPPGGDPDGRNAAIQYTVSGPDLGKLNQYAQAMLARMKTVPDVVDADSSLVLGKPELRISIDRERAADLGVRVNDIAQALNIMVAGQNVSTFETGADQYDVRLRATSESRASADTLKRLTVASNKRGWVSLDDVVVIREGAGPAAIDRLNRQREVTLFSNVRPGGSEAAVISRLNDFARDLNLDPGYKTELGGTSKELGRTGYYFILAISLSFIFMYMVLAAQFESFLHPVTILLTLPMAVPFGIVALLLARQTINVFSGLGLLLLFGIVKKNAILQIDHTNGLRNGGMARFDAIIQANRDRLRPILMTTASLVAGMIPLVVAGGPGAATNRSIGVLVAGGQTLCLLLTLLAVPVFYSLFEDWREATVWKKLAEVAEAQTARIKVAARAFRARGSESEGAPR
jgi:hydrophobic/amphiphilic exporter-1 (mainly G- bacteria), HAE1 family